MLKNTRHSSYYIRTHAARALRRAGKNEELEALLRDPDPRLRRAGLDGIIDVWLLGSTGGNALKAEQFTPGISRAISAILANPAEAWFVKDAALQALYSAPADVIKENIPRVIPCATHPEWWLRCSAFDALLGLRKDPAQESFRAQLPTLINTMINEYHTWPRDHMTKELANAMLDPAQNAKVLEPGFGTPLPQPKGIRTEPQDNAQIAAGFVRAARDSKILSNVGENLRSAEGAYNVRLAAQACAQRAPSEMAALAEAMNSNIVYLSDAELVSIIAAPNAQRELKILGVSYNVVYAGFFPSMDIMPPKQKQQLIETLYHDYRPELARRIRKGSKPGEAANGELLDSLVDITKLKSSIAGWEPAGIPSPASRVWRYQSFRAGRPQDKLDVQKESTLVDAALPAGMEKWYQPGFDDTQWKQGRAPIGVGEYVANGHSYTNNSAWGEGEFLVMRTTFDVADLNCDYYRVAVLANKGYHIYLNGVEIKSYGWWQHTPFYNPIVLSEREARLLKKGTNTLAVYTMVGFDPKHGHTPVGQIDVMIEGLKKDGLMLAESDKGMPSPPPRSAYNSR